MSLNKLSSDTFATKKNNLEINCKDFKCNVFDSDSMSSVDFESFLAEVKDQITIVDVTSVDGATIQFIDENSNPTTSIKGKTTDFNIQSINDIDIKADVLELNADGGGSQIIMNGVKIPTGTGDQSDYLMTDGVVDYTFKDYYDIKPYANSLSNVSPSSFNVVRFSPVNVIWLGGEYNNFSYDNAGNLTALVTGVYQLSLEMSLSYSGGVSIGLTNTCVILRNSSELTYLTEDKTYDATTESGEYVNIRIHSTISVNSGDVVNVQLKTTSNAPNDVLHTIYNFSLSLDNIGHLLTT